MRHQNGSLEQRIFSALKKLIALRKEITAFADFDNRQLLTSDNPYLLLFSRTDPLNNRNKVRVVGNFNIEPQHLNITELEPHGFFLQDGMKDLCTGSNILAENDTITLPALPFYWLCA